MKVLDYGWLYRIINNKQEKKMLKAYKYRIYPNKKQESLLTQTFGCVRKLWNYNVDIFNKQEKPLTSTELRKEFVFMRGVSAAAIQQKELDFKLFKNSFFSKSIKKKLGRPNFKSKDNNQSFRLPNQKFYIKENKIQLERVGKVKITLDREIPTNSKLMSVTISRDKVNKYFASILVEQEIEPKTKTGAIIGIDVGLNSFLVGSDGLVVENPRFYRESQAELTRVQRRLSKKKSGSNRRKKAKLKVARVHSRVVNKRKDFSHKLSTTLVSTYDVIAIEGLNISGMLKNHKLAKSISDASWSEFNKQLEYKCLWYGKKLIKVDRFFASSKICNNCGFKNKDLILEDRQWTCPSCLVSLDRDLNASKNILDEALRVDSAIRTPTGPEAGLKRLRAE